MPPVFSLLRGYMHLCETDESTGEKVDGIELSTRLKKNHLAMGDECCATRCLHRKRSMHLIADRAKCISHHFNHHATWEHHHDRETAALGSREARNGDLPIYCRCRAA